MLRDRLPLRTKRRLKRVWWRTRTPTARWRSLPDFIIIGAQKAGTTSLFRYLTALPQVARPFGQEPVFFSHEIKFARGPDEYRANFPLRAGLHHRITGEASGEYLYYPDGPERIAELVPAVRLIVVLRDPVDRTISQYFHNVKLGLEELSLEDAIHRELTWHQEHDPITGPPHRQFGPLGGARAYLGRSMYAEHLARWFNRFDDSQLLIVEAESLYDDPRATTAEVCDFLEVPRPQELSFSQHNAGARTEIDADLSAWLTSIFRGPNDELGLLLRNRLGERAPDLRWVH